MRKSKSISFDEAITNLINGIAKEFNEKCTTLEDYKNQFNGTLNLLLTLRDIQLTARSDDKLRAEFKKLLLKLINTKEETSTDNTADIERKITKLQEKYLKRAKRKSNLLAVKAKVEAKRPESHIEPNTKASNKAFSNDNLQLYQERMPLSLEGANSKKEFSSYMIISYDDSRTLDMKLCGPYEGKKLTSFDRIVHDAIVTLYIAGNRFITTHMIYMVIKGKIAPSSKLGISPEWRRAINESIDRMFHTVVDIDATEHFKAYKKENAKIHYKGHVLECEIVTAEINGQITTCIEVFKTPILYRYADDYGQVIRTKLEIFDIPTLDNTVENSIMVNHLVHRVRVMQHDTKKSRTIRYDSILEILGIQANSTNDIALRKKKKNIREKIIKCCEYWKAKKFIKGYKEEKEGKAIAKITLQI